MENSLCYLILQRSHGLAFLSLCGTESDMLFVDSAAAQVSQLRTLTHPTLYTGHRKPSRALLASKNWLWCAGIMSYCNHF